jgi:hypothetical protein
VDTLSSVEPDLLLEVEDPATVFAEDARHWVNIYARLLEFKERVRERMTMAMSELPAQTCPEAHEELALLTDELARVQRRLAFWRQRHWELIGLDLCGEDHTVMYAGKRLYLTNREFQLLSFMAAHPNRYFSPTAMVGSAWHDSRLSPEQLRVYVSRLREKLASLDAPCRIDNRPGQGYGLVLATPAPA